MNLLPPVGWNDIATKADLVALSTSLRGEIAELRGDMKAGNAELLRTLFFAMVASNATLRRRRVRSGEAGLTSVPAGRRLPWSGGCHTGCLG